MGDILFCKYCEENKSESCFQVARVIKGKVYMRKKCTACKTKDKKLRSKHIKEWLEKYKSTLICLRCGFDDFRAIVFHHRDGKTKDINIGDVIRMGWSIERIKKELAKCDPLCANCHQIYHYEERKLLRLVV